MRLKESTLAVAYLAPRIAVRGKLGGMAEGFSDRRIALRASVLPDGGGLSTQERGAVNRERLRLLVPGDTAARCGDGIFFGNAMWRIVELQRWSAHTELVCEAVS